MKVLFNDIGGSLIENGIRENERTKNILLVLLR
jgi:hypothetical protein